MNKISYEAYAVDPLCTFRNLLKVRRHKAGCYFTAKELHEHHITHSRDTDLVTVCFKKLCLKMLIAEGVALYLVTGLLWHSWSVYFYKGRVGKGTLSILSLKLYLSGYYTIRPCLMLTNSKRKELFLHLCGPKVWDHVNASSYRLNSSSSFHTRMFHYKFLALGKYHKFFSAWFNITIKIWN